MSSVGTKEFLKSFSSDVPKTLIWIGHSVGNTSKAEATKLINDLSPLLSVGDNFLVGMVPCRDATIQTPKLNCNLVGPHLLDSINKIVAKRIFDLKKFDFYSKGDWVSGRQETYCRVLVEHDISLNLDHQSTPIRIKFEKNETLLLDYFYKWSPMESANLFQDARLTKVLACAGPSHLYDLHMLRKNPFYLNLNFNLKRLQGTSADLKEDDNCVMPSVEDWNELWKAWNLVTMEMISEEMLLEQPIPLRLPLIFYIGHIPTFIDIQLSNATNEKLTEAAYFTEIFERGIDPDMDNPTQCHVHSRVPSQWPNVTEIVSYRDRVCERLYRVMADTRRYPNTRRKARHFFMGFEHQALHLETILFMLVQSKHVKPPPGINCPWAGELGAGKLRLVPPPILSPANWVIIDPSRLDAEALDLGHNDLESTDLLNPFDLKTEFGWDNEHPHTVPSHQPLEFAIQSRHVTNAEFLNFWIATTENVGKSGIELPKSWSWAIDSSDICVRSVFGLVPMSVAGSWPMCCSQKDALAYIAWLDPNGTTYSLPTEHQLSIAFKLKQGEPNSSLSDSNYGFKLWYPRSTISSYPKATPELEDFHGPGGVCDWTSTPFAPLDEAGYVQSKIYPGFSWDFFDGKHFVVLGASWALHPTVAERRSYRNWFQSGYGYTFTGFRLVKNLK